MLSFAVRIAMCAPTSHRNGQLVCRYCGLSVPMPDRCPVMRKSDLHRGVFGLGTQKVETMVKKYFPSARTLRMDMDSTSRKDSHGKILSSFAKGEADVLIGTQIDYQRGMISRV